ncbi:MAG: cellulase family glycosylhydrolase [Mucilaginibacter sp.]|nr:cellulase family glycosylhydrolase [Mucilaginibacter sp.]
MSTFTRMFRTTACCAVAIMLMACSKKSVTPNNNNNNSSGNNTNNPPAETKGFAIQDSKIIGPDDKEFVPVGINVNGPYWPWSHATLPDVGLIADTWKFNSVRLNCWPEFSSNNQNNTDMDGIIKAFTDKKVVVMIEEHNWTGRYPTADELATLSAWYKDLAIKYKNNPYVWFNIMNEPGPANTDVPADWLNDHDIVIKTIRDAGNNNIIVCDEHGYGQAGGYTQGAKQSGVLTYGTNLTAKYKNVMFSLHTYDLWVYGDTRLQNYINDVTAKKLALMIGEFGVGADLSSAVATSVYKNAVPKNIGRLGWQWDGTDVHKLTTTGSGGGYAIDNVSGAKPGNLSFVGNLLWQDTHGGVNPGSADLIPPAVLAANLSFENGSPQSGSKNIENWINFGTAELDNTAADVNNGMYAIKIPSGGAGGAGQFLYLAPGATYKITAWGKNSAAVSAASSLGIKVTATQGGAESQIVSLDFTANGGSTKTGTFSTPASLNSVFLFIYKNDANVDFWLDNISIQKQ